MAVAAEISIEWAFAGEAFPEQEVISRQRLAACLGSMAVRGSAEMLLDTQPEAETVDNSSTLLSAIQMAALGDTESLLTVKTNAATDLAERMYKVAHQTEVEMDFSGGKWGQNGRIMTDIHGNTLRNTVLKPEMLRRTKLELQNALFFEELYAVGVLETHAAVVFSPASTTMSVEEKKEYNFFVDTESCSVQVLTTEGESAKLQTAMVAGKATPQSGRHDIATIHKLAANNGLEVGETDGTAILQYVMLVPKQSIPNGVSDIVKQYDEAAGYTFYGQAEPRQDYVQYAAECQARNRNFSQSVDDITAQLIREAHLYTSPLEAIERLDYLSERLCVQYAVHNDTINEAVFGAKSALHIQEARFFIEQGDMLRAETSLRKAQDTAESGSCPLFKAAKENGGDGAGGSGPNSSSDGELSGKKLMSCPFCKAKVYDDPCAKKLSCWDCKAMVMDGKVRSQGNGGARSRSERRWADFDERRAAEKVTRGTAFVGAATP